MVFKAFLIFGGVYAKALERVAVPLLCYCVGCGRVWGIGRGTGGGRGPVFRGRAGTVGVAAPLSGCLLIPTVLKASQELQHTRGFT